MRTDKTNTHIIQQIADQELKLNEVDIFAIVDFQFKAVKKAMTAKQFVELPRLGRFYVKEGRDKYIAPEKRFYEPHMRSSSADTNDEESN